MNVEVWPLILSTVQTLVIVFTFAGLMWQLRRVNQSIRNDAYSKAIEDYSKISQLLIDKPQLSRLFYSNNVVFKSLSSDEQDFYNFLALAIGLIERIYLQFRKGWVDRETWESWERWLVEQWFHVMLFDLFWKNERAFFSVEFSKYVDKKYESYKAIAQSMAQLIVEPERAEETH